MTSADISHDRWSKRREVEVDVVIHDGEHQPMRGLMINISIGGAYVEMDGELPALDSAISLDFKIETDDAPEYHHMPARVAHIDQTGIGIVIDDYDRETVDALKRLMKSVLS